MNRCTNLPSRVGSLILAALLVCGVFSTAASQTLEELKNKKFKGQPIEDLLSSGGMAAVFGPDEPITSPGELKRGGHDNGRGGNTFVNDPCLDPPPTAPPPERRRRTVQSETEIAVLNVPGSMGKKMVAGYNDSWGFYNNRQGLSGFAYSTDGGNTWIDGGGLPPRVPTGLPNVVIVGFPAPPAGQDGYFGDPVVVVHHRSQTFYYASIYKSTNGYFTLSVNRGRFTNAPPQNSVESESVANTRCLNRPEQHGIPDPPSNQKERITWEPPVEAVTPPNLGTDNQDFLDKEWLYVDQNSGTLYVTYTRFEPNGATPIELVRCIGCANIMRPLLPTDWTPPSVIVPNEALEFNQATMPFTTPTGRVIVTWHARTFDPTFTVELEQRIEYAYSDDDGITFTPEQLVSVVNPQGEPPGYNRARATILNAPYIFVDRGSDDGVFSSQEQGRPGFGNVYITYFDGKTPLGSVTPAADIFLSTSSDNATTFGPRVKVNDDNTNTVHVFPSVQANKNGNVFVAWIDRRQDPDPFAPGPPPSGGNIFNDTYAAVSHDFGASFGHNKVQTETSTQWFVRADARPNFGDYNSSELLGFNQFVTVWADGRFRPPGGDAATPDMIFTIANGLGVGNDPNPNR